MATQPAQLAATRGLQRCFGCGEPAQAGGQVIHLEASAGPRGTIDTAQWSTVPTETRGIRVCDTCLFTPEWAMVLAIIEHPGKQRVERYGGQCVVLCSSRKPRRGTRIKRIMPRGIFTWPHSGAYTCPMCYRSARGWSIKHSPRAIRDLASKVARRTRLSGWYNSQMGR